MARFAYYDRLSAKEQATYRKSDDVPRVALPNPSVLAKLASAIDVALASGKRVRVARASAALAQALCAQLEVPPVAIHVRETRPALKGGELHGLYTFAIEADGKPPKIEVWMRTHANGRVVRFRTFLRTLLHELVHHLDVVLLGLDDSFHTEGFLRRESSLMRQIAGAAPTHERAERAAAPPVRVDAATRTVPFEFASGLGGLAGSQPPTERRPLDQPSPAPRPTSRQLSLFG